MKKKVLKYYTVVYVKEYTLDIACDTIYVDAPDRNSSDEVAERFTNFFLRIVDVFTHSKRIKNIIKTDADIYITYTEMNSDEVKVFRAELKEFIL